MNNLSLFFFILVMILQGSIVPFLRRFVEPEEGNGFVVQKAPKPIHVLCWTGQDLSFRLWVLSGVAVKSNCTQISVNIEVLQASDPLLCASSSRAVAVWHQDYVLCQGTGVLGVSRIVTQSFLVSNPFLGVLNDHGTDVLRELQQLKILSSSC